MTAYEPGTPVRVNPHHAQHYRLVKGLSRDGVIERAASDDEPLYRSLRPKEVLYWVAFPDGAGDPFWESELEVRT